MRISWHKIIEIWPESLGTIHPIPSEFNEFNASCHLQRLDFIYMFMIIYDVYVLYVLSLLSQEFGTQTEVPLSGTHASAVAAALDVLRPESVLIFVCPNAGESVAWCNGWTTWEGYGKLERWCIDSVALDWNENQKSRGICQRLFGSHQGPYLEWNILCPKFQRL